MSSLHWRVLCGNRDYRGGGPALEWSFTGDDDTWTPVAVFAHSDQAMAAKAEVERYAGEEYAMRAGMEAKPTAGAFAALADWLREHGRDGEADMAAKDFEAVAASVAEFNAYERAVFAVDLDAVRPRTELARHCGSAELSAAVRGLLKELGIQGVTVTTERRVYNGATQLRVPARCDADTYMALTNGTRVYWHPSAARNRRAEDRLDSILARAFPNHDDRSESQSDYFNYCYSTSQKWVGDYRPKPKKLKPAPAPKPDGWDQWATVTIARAEFKVEPLGTRDGFPAAEYRLHGVKGGTVYELRRNVRTKHMLYACHGKPGRFGCAKVRGYSWFSDHAGALEPVS